MDVAELGPFATLLVASVALFVGVRTVRQRDRADRRGQWWKRAQWATDLTLSDDWHRRELGFTAFGVLAHSGWLGRRSSNCSTSR